MEITIVGPGAVGTLLGGLLQLKGHRVTLRGRGPAKGPARPLRIVLPRQWLVVEGMRRAGPGEDTGTPDATFVALGRHQLHAVRKPEMQRWMPEEAGPAAFFNCDPAEPDRLSVPRDRGRLCITLLNAVKLQDDDVELTTERSALIYEKHPLLAEVFEDLAGFGIELHPVDDARPHSNSFFLTQLLFLPAAMCNTTLDCFLSFPEGRELAARLLEEGFETMDRADLPMAALPLLDPRELALRVRKKPESFQPARKAPDRGYNSVLQGYLRGRPVEAMQLNRKLVEIASAAGLHLTWNWRILQKANRAASIGFYRDPAELMQSLA